MLTLAQAFIARPKLLMIDELSLGLAPVIVEQLLEIVRAIHDNGTTIVVVEQSVNVAITLAERAVFLEKGEVRFDGPTARSPRPARDPARRVPRGRRAAHAHRQRPAQRQRPAAVQRALRPLRPRAPVVLELDGLSASLRRRARRERGDFGVPRARSSASSARTAPARRPCSTSSRAS